MSKGAINFTNNNEYYTPKELVARFGNMDYDPATTKEKAEEFGVAEYDTIETNGLLNDWTKYKRIWINPPFTDKHIFFKKAVETVKKANNEIYFLMPIEFLTTKRFHNLLDGIGGVLYLPNGRIKFERNIGEPSKSPAFGSVILKLQNESELTIKRINI